jgi:glycogen debranching enzyme
MRALACAAICIATAMAGAQAAPSGLSPLTSFPINDPGLPHLSIETVPLKPFSVVGPRGAILGQQDGTYEAWIFPWKIFSQMRISVLMKDYPVPIDVNRQSAWIDAQPDATTITYSHANFTIRQTMIAPRSAANEDGPIVFYQFESVRPMTITFSMHPGMKRMWPAESDDIPSPEWVTTGDGSGYYILHENFPENGVAMAIPGTEAGILAPYQERARSWPLQFVLHFDPATDSGKIFPLLLVSASTAQAAQKTALIAGLSRLNASAAEYFKAHEAYYANFLREATSIETPDETLNAAFTWGVVAINQLRVKTTPDLDEEALTAGFVGSGDSARPGFGWFFGRDALWTLFAVNSYGDFETSRKEIEFLLRRQRSDGKIMHEWSQTANLVDWAALPYEYASADATPLLQMALNDYLETSGDSSFIERHWNNILLAWQFETAHTSPDGIYNNSQGSGWVESWIPRMPLQEIYLALLDEQASAAFARLARATHHADLAAQAEQRAEKINQTIAREYYLPDQASYAFSRNPDGSCDQTSTIFPAVSMWSYSSALPNLDSMLSRWASSEFSTDWGARILSERVGFYDPISYHQGSVWPLFTGWLAVAEYRGGHPLAGYASLMQNANLTWSQDPGSVTELLSGQYYQVLGRSTAHQLWSSAMVVSPILRGMFGIEWDAASHKLTVSPHLPADWDRAMVRNLPLGAAHLDLGFQREKDHLLVTASGAGAAGLRMESRIPGATHRGEMLDIPLPAVEVFAGAELPSFGSETKQMKVLEEKYLGKSLALTLSAPAGSTESMSLRENLEEPALRVDGAELQSGGSGTRTVIVHFPQGTGYVQQNVTIDW